MSGKEKIQIATVLVAGSAIFNEQATVAENLRKLQSAIEKSPGRARKGK